VELLPEEDDDKVRAVATYVLKDRKALQAYFAEHASRLRGDGMSRFEGKFSATRRILSRLRSV
jgi:hypothetical protein